MSEGSVTETPKNELQVTKYNWQLFSNALHQWASSGGLHKEGIPMFDMGSANEIHFLSLETAGETGEFANCVKKQWRDGVTPQLMDKILGELADMTIMLHHLHQYYGVDPDENAAKKMQELHARWPFCPREIKTRDELYPFGTVVKWELDRYRKLSDGFIAAGEVTDAKIHAGELTTPKLDVVQIKE